MTRLVQFANNAVSTLAAGITNSATSLSVAAGDGAKFPTLTGSKYFLATLVKLDGSTEIIKVTARSTDTFTIVRAAEPVGGSSTAYAFSTGDRIELRMTSGALSGELDRLDAAAFISPLNKSADYTILEADKTSLVRVTTTSGNVVITLPSIAGLTDDFDVIVAKVTSDANTVTLARSSTDLINGNASYTLISQWQSVWLIADRSTNTWTAINSGASANVVADSGTGSGSATLTLSGDPGSKNNVALFIGGVYQQKSTFSVSGTTLTAGGAVASGVVWEAVWTTPSSIGTPSDGTVTTAKLGDGAVTNQKMAAGAAVANIGYTPANDSAAMHLAGAETATGAKRGAVVALTDGATITPDFAAGNNFSVTLGGNRTLANPSNLTAGQSGIIAVTQDATGSRTLAFGSYWKFANGTAETLTTTANAVDLLAYYVDSSTAVTIKKLGDRK